MIRARLIGTAVLAVFAANALLCPCSWLPGSADPAPIAEPGVHEGGAHAMHGEKASETNPAGPDCHTDSAASDCSMASSLDAEARPGSGSTSGAEQPPALAIPDFTGDPALSRRRESGPIAHPPDPRSAATPVTKHERLLI